MDILRQRFVASEIGFDC